MFCPKCGANIPDGAKFCGKCGAVMSPEKVAGAGHGMTGAPKISPVAGNVAKVSTSFPKKAAIAPSGALPRSAIVDLIGTAIVMILMFMPWADGGISSGLNQLLGTSVKSSYTVPDLVGMSDQLVSNVNSLNSAVSSLASSYSGESHAVSVANPTSVAVSPLDILMVVWVVALIACALGVVLLFMRKGKVVSVIGLILCVITAMIVSAAISYVNSQAGFQMFVTSMAPMLVILCSIATIIGVFVVKDA